MSQAANLSPVIDNMRRVGVARILFSLIAISGVLTQRAAGTLAEEQGSEGDAAPVPAALLEGLLGPDLAQLVFAADIAEQQDSSELPQGEIGEEARLAPLSDEMVALRRKVRRALLSYFER